MLKKVFKQLLNISKFTLMFLVIYFALNWWRQPVMPVNSDLQLTDYQGQMIDLNQMSEQQPILVYFWGSWCGVCKISSPKINQLANEGYPVVTIAVSSGGNSDIQLYLKEHGYDFTVINDSEGDIFKAWEGQVTPSYVILDKGEMTQGLTGIQPVWSLKLRLWLSKIF